MCPASEVRGMIEYPFFVSLLASRFCYWTGISKPLNPDKLLDLVGIGMVVPRCCCCIGILMQSLPI